MTNVEIQSVILDGKLGRTETLTYMANDLYEKGYVKEIYKDALLEREATYPTGVPSEPIAVAMPHAARETVNKCVISVAKLEAPIDFCRMDNPEATIPARIIFMLAIDSNDGELDVIMKIMDLVQNQEVMQKIIGMNSVEDITKIVKEHIA